MFFRDGGQNFFCAHAGAATWKKQRNCFRKNKKGIKRKERRARDQWYTSEKLSGPTYRSNIDNPLRCRGIPALTRTVAGGLEAPVKFPESFCSAIFRLRRSINANNFFVSWPRSACLHILRTSCVSNASRKTILYTPYYFHQPTLWGKELPSREYRRRFAQPIKAIPFDGPFYLGSRSFMLASA